MRASCRREGRFTLVEARDFLRATDLLDPPSAALNTTPCLDQFKMDKIIVSDT